MIENKQLPRGYSHRRAGRHSLKTLAPYHLGVEPFWETPFDHDNDKYVLQDCQYTYALALHLQERLKKQDSYKFYLDKLMPWGRMFLEAENRGVELDMIAVGRGELEAGRRARELKKELDDIWADAHAAYRQMQLDELRAAYEQKRQANIAKLKNPTTEKVQRRTVYYAGLYEAAAAKVEGRVDYNSPKQLAWLLRDYLQLDITNFFGKESTDAEVLERLANQGAPGIRTLLDYRKYQKLASTYYPAYQTLSHKGVLHSSFNLQVAKTGRTSSSSPNLQNQPSEVRSLFRARKGHRLITKDFSSIEPVMVAYYSEDEKLCKLIQQGLKFHSYNAAALFNIPGDPKLITKETHPLEYRLSKLGGLSVLYGAGARQWQKALAENGIHWSDTECHEAVKRLRDSWPEVTAFKKAIDQMAEEGKPIRNVLGRARSFKDNPDDVYMQAFNSLMQGSASDLLLQSARKSIDELREMGIKAYLLMTVHDEAVFEVPTKDAKKADAIITKNMTGYKLETKWGPIPLTVEGGISEVWEK